MVKINIPLTVPAAARKNYERNWRLATKNSGRLFLFAGDQKVEHLNNDFFGPGLERECNNPEHLFQIASQAEIGVFASQLGLIARYGKDYPKVPYLIKINAKTNLMPEENGSLSQTWATVADVVRFKKQSGLDIVGIGFTIYLGSQKEPEILQAASQAILEAHQNGLLAVLWIYPRGPKVKNDEDIHLLAGAAGVAACLGADFAKLKYPYGGGDKNALAYQEVTEAAGRTKVICVGGSKINPKSLLEDMSRQIKISKTGGQAVGRNIHQYPLAQAVRMANAIAAVSIYGYSATEAHDILTGKAKLRKTATKTTK